MEYNTYVFDIEARHFRDSKDFLNDCPLKRSFNENFEKDITVGLKSVTIDNSLYKIVSVLKDKKYNGFDYNLLYDMLNDNQFVDKSINDSMKKFKNLISRKKKVGKVQIILKKV